MVTDARGPVHPAQQLVPVGPVHVPEGQPQPAHHVGVQALAVQHLGDVVDRRRVGRGDHGLLVHVAHQADLALQPRADRPVGPADDRVGLDADAAQRGHRVLGRLGLELAGRPDVGQQGHVQEEAPVPADLVPDLADRLQERLRLDVAHRAADLGDDDVGLRAAHGQDARLDLVGDVRDDLDGVAQVVAAALLGDHAGVDLAGRHVGRAGQADVQETLVMAHVEVGLRAVVGDEDLAVLEGVHGAGVDVQVRVELLHVDPQTAQLQQPADAGSGEALAQAGGDSPGNEQVPGTDRP